MKSDLTLNIGTKYNGDGMKKLDSALKTSAKTVSNTTRALGAISSEMNQMGGTAGKAAGAVSGLFSAFAAGGAVAVAIAAITTAVGWLIKAFQTAQEKAKDAATAIKESFENAIKDSVSAFDKIEAKLKNIFRQNTTAKENSKEYADIEYRQAANKIKSDAQFAREQAGNDKYKVKEIDAQEKRDLALLEAEQSRKTENATVELLNKNREALAQAIVEQEKAVEDATKKVQEQEFTVKSRDAKGRDLYSIYQRLESNVSQAESDKSQYGTNYYIDGENTVGKVFENAVAERTKFEKENSTFIEGLKSYETSQQNLTALNEKLAAQKQELAATEEKEKIAKAKAAVANEEYATKVDAINVEYDNEIKTIELERKKTVDRITKEGKRLSKAQQKEDERKKLEDKLKKAEQDKAKLLEDEKKTAVQTLQEQKAAQKAAKELAEAQKKAAEVINDWKDNPQQNFAKWQQNNKQQQREQQRAQQQQQENLENAGKEQAALGKRIFDRNGIRKTANIFDIGRFAEIADYTGFENVSDDQISKLKTKRDELRKKLFNEDGTVKRGVSEIGQDMTIFKKLDKALANKDKVDAANAAQKKAEELEMERAEKEDKRTEALESIDGVIQDIRDKLKNLGV